MSTTKKAVKPRRGVAKEVAYNNGFYTAVEIQKMLECGQTFAYQVIKNLNAELEAQGFITVRGKISKRYFHEKYYG